jgi:cytosine/adenosine deaminase-related metal-dependent hydrolase
MRFWSPSPPAYTLRGGHVVLDPLTGHNITAPLHLRARVLASAPRQTRTIDLAGAVVLPALINAHDHLELNHYPRTTFAARYDDAHQWGRDVSARLTQAPYTALRQHPLNDQVLIGGIKNLLCGALTVIHHNPPHKALFNASFPVRVLRRYGWVHSFGFSTPQQIANSYQRTPQDHTWFIHLAEGTNATAAREYQQLQALGCISGRTVLIHAVGISPDNIVHAARVPLRAVVTCPSTNRYLLDAHMPYTTWQQHAPHLPVWLGSDSRLTADGDLLDELRALPADVLHPTLLWGAFDGVGLAGGHLREGAPADLVVIRLQSADTNATQMLATIHRAQIALVMRGGIPQIGDPDLMHQFADVPTVAARLDGVPKRIHRVLATALARSSLQEQGLLIGEHAI